MNLPHPYLVLFCLIAATPAIASDPAKVIEFPTPAPMSLPSGLDVAPNGDVFYAEAAAGKIALLQDMKFTREYALPSGASPNSVKVAGDGVWFSDGGNSAIGRLDPNSGAVIEYRVPSGGSPNFL